MNKLVVFLGFLLFSSSVVCAQFRGQEPRNPSVTEGVTQSRTSLEAGLFDLSRLEMRHSVSVSYGISGDEGLGTSMYVNSLRYRLSKPLSIRADIGMMFSPFGSAAQHMTSDLSGVFLKRASIDYAPSKDLRLSLQFRNEPYLSRYSGWNYGAADGYDMFENDDRLFP